MAVHRGCVCPPKSAGAPPHRLPAATCPQPASGANSPRASIASALAGYCRDSTSLPPPHGDVTGGPQALEAPRRPRVRPALGARGGEAADPGLAKGGGEGEIPLPYQQHVPRVAHAPPPPALLYASHPAGFLARADDAPPLLGATRAAAPSAPPRARGRHRCGRGRGRGLWPTLQGHVRVWGAANPRGAPCHDGVRWADMGGRHQQLPPQCSTALRQAGGAGAGRFLHTVGTVLEAVVAASGDPRAPRWPAWLPRPGLARHPFHCRPLLSSDVPRPRWAPQVFGETARDVSG